MQISSNQIMELIKPFVKYSNVYKMCTDPDLKRKIYNDWHEEIKTILSKTPTTIKTTAATAKVTANCHDCGYVSEEDDESSSTLIMSPRTSAAIELWSINSSSSSSSSVFFSLMVNHVTKSVAEQSRFCDYCYMVTNDCKGVACDYCFFPFYEHLLMDKELATYVLLSACFYQENYVYRNNQEAPVLVWIMRLKLNWQMFADNNNYNNYNVDNTAKKNDNKRYKIIVKKCVQCDSINDNVVVNSTYVDFTLNIFCYKCLFPLFIIEYLQ
ncbi:AC52 [Trabala vishnou gigantina nucleopolyhedrovirus]|uniref:AC52 n=1 Tax=Trabala vishnou gigantina nucleopolyhedrovirus TaxID=2863583 RepID=UPI002481B817|nr:AC52 [Trabala vishnou gigantina nucleopolyhedrovirus]QYC92718.1 AC52 [Trabala vishnou gigantina nucleopolyhedrovirus]